MNSIQYTFCDETHRLKLMFLLSFFQTEWNELVKLETQLNCTIFHCELQIKT